MKKMPYKTLQCGLRDTSEAIKGKDIFYKCNKCQSIIASIPRDNVGCSGGNIEIDKDLNRLLVRNFSDFLLLKRIVYRAEKPS